MRLYDLIKRLAGNDAEALAWLEAVRAPRPDWEAAPATAICWAVNVAGHAMWYSVDVVPAEDGQWVPPRGGVPYAVFDRIVDLPVGLDWRSTKQHRLSTSDEISSLRRVAA